MARHHPQIKRQENSGCRPALGARPGHNLGRCAHGREGVRVCKKSDRWRWPDLIQKTLSTSYPPLTAPAVNPATIWRCANTVNSSTGSVTISAAAASGPQLNWSKEIML